MTHGGRAPAHPFLSIVLLSLAVSAGPAAAFAPEASVWLASRLPEALPPAAREPLWATETTRVLERRWLEEEEAPERAAILHRFDALRPRSGGNAPSGEDSLAGLAPFALVSAAADLRDALRRSNPVESAEALARIAQTVADLADPFLTTPHHPQETPGARAWFGDGFTPDDVTGTVVPHGLAGDAYTAALALARESAASREAVEQATRAADGGAMVALRRQRLERALAFGAGLVRRAWRDAGAPVATAPLAHVRIEPNPARGEFALLFAVASPGEARLEVFDVQGRRWVAGSLGPVEAGVHRIPIERKWLSGVPAGIYLARISVGTACAVGRFVRVVP